jgi:hypothetical protein
MSQPTGDVRTSAAAVLAAAGVKVTEDGLARYRERLAKARARLTPEALDEMRAQVGLPPRNPA